MRSECTGTLDGAKRNHFPPGSGFRALALCVSALSALQIGSALSLPSQRAQETGPHAFAVVSIRPNNGKERGGRFLPYAVGDRWSSLNFPIRAVIKFAFSLDWAGARLSGGPNWVAVDNYDIQATGAHNARSAALRGMVRAMLVSRFGLRYHWETRQVPSYELTVAKGGPRLEAHTGPCASPQLPAPQGPPVGTNVCGVVHTVSVEQPPGSRRGLSLRRDVLAKGVTMTDLAYWIEGQMRPLAPVADETGLKGEFDFRLRIEGATDRESAMLNLSRALQSTLGLNLSLRLKEHATPVLVIDRIERPTPN